MNDATTERLYFTDSRVLAFEATVLAVLPATEAGRSRVRLDRTAFYPEGGGQPCDFGTLAGRPVVDVAESAAGDGAIWHSIEGVPFAAGERVAGSIDVARRFDHMQQHTGQHLLSRVFVVQIGLDTTSFHLGDEACTIDLATAGLTDRQIVAAEELAAEIIRAARPVRIRVGPEAGLALRKDGSASGASATDPDYRVISIDGFDDCACGGTHVANTAEIEAIAVRRVERINDSRCRVEFVCGGRARRDYRAKRERLRDLSRLLSAEEFRLADATRAALEKQKDSDKRVRELIKELLPARVDRLLAAAPDVAGRRLVIATIDAADKSELAGLAQEMARRQKVVGALIAVGDKAQLACVAGPDSGISAADWLRAVLAPLGGQGGGSPHLAQGGLPREHAAAALAAAEAHLRATVGG